MLPRRTCHRSSGLVAAMETLKGVSGIGFVPFNEQDVVRHPLVKRIIKAYDHASR